MFRKITYFYFAAVFTAAFFLYSNNATTEFVSGKVEFVVLENDKAKEIGILKIKDSVKSNHLIATAKGSRAEIKHDSKLWRLGSLTAAQWLNDESFWIHSGSALLCTEENSTVHFSSIESNATFIGNGTIIVEATSNGGFKFIPLEAKGSLTTAEGGTKVLQEGRMLFVLDNPSNFGDAYDIDLMLLVKSSRLLNYFPSPLPTFDQIGLAIYVQQLKLKGKYDALIGDATSKDNLQIWKFGKNAGKSVNSSDNTKGFFNKLFTKD